MTEDVLQRIISTVQVLLRVWNLTGTERRLSHGPTQKNAGATVFTSRGPSPFP